MGDRTRVVWVHERPGVHWHVLAEVAAIAVLKVPGKQADVQKVAERRKRRSGQGACQKAVLRRVCGRTNARRLASGGLVVARCARCTRPQCAPSTFRTRQRPSCQPKAQARRDVPVHEVSPAELT